MTVRRIKPEIDYLFGNAVVPAKALSYKLDKATNTPIEVVKPRTHKFETDLRNDLKKALKNVTRFPTKKPVFVSILHALHSRTEYDNCDLDNRAKTVLDSLKEVVYLDDSQVKMLWTRKGFLTNQSESFFRISVKILNLTTVKKASDIYPLIK